MRLTVHPRALLVLLLPVAVVLVLVSLVATLVGLASPGGAPFEGYERLMDVVSVDEETTVPSWFSASLLLLCALLLLDVARTARARRDRWRYHWALLTLVFAYLSADEGSRLHEIGTSVVEMAGIDTGLRFSWVLVALPVAAVFALAMVPFLLALPRRTALLFVLAGCVYVGAAAGLEVVGSAVAPLEEGSTTAGYAALTSVEELFEMVGAILFAWAVADHQRRAVAAAAAADARSGSATRARQGEHAAPARVA